MSSAIERGDVQFARLYLVGLVFGLAVRFPHVIVPLARTVHAIVKNLPGAANIIARFPELRR